jgi:hypothetical protein
MLIVLVIASTLLIILVIRSRGFCLKQVFSAAKAALGLLVVGTATNSPKKIRQYLGTDT